MQKETGTGGMWLPGKDCLSLVAVNRTSKSGIGLILALAFQVYPRDFSWTLLADEKISETGIARETERRL